MLHIQAATTIASCSVTNLAVSPTCYILVEPLPIEICLQAEHIRHEKKDSFIPWHGYNLHEGREDLLVLQTIRS